jgi:nitrogen-specific signal transduction histidine kinase
MEIIAVLSTRDDELVHKVKELLAGYTVYPVASPGELEELHGSLPLSLVLVDALSFRISSLDDFLKRLDNDTIVIFFRGKPDLPGETELPPSVYGFVNPYSLEKDLPIMVERAMEKQRLRNEISFLKKTGNSRSDSRTADRQTPPEKPPASANTTREGRYLHEKVLLNFAKMLTANFDLDKLLNHFMDSVMEIARVGRMSILLKERNFFYIKTHQGLDPYIAESMKLRMGSALVLRLTQSGRIVQKPVLAEDAESLGIRDDMKLLYASLSFPMMQSGKLIGIFNMDDKITGEPLRREELEVIYVLCNYLAAAVKDVALYNKVWYQKEFTKNIISSMSSGIIVIDRERKITVFNQRASEILNLRASEVVGSSVRILPSPLCDILTESMVTGSSYKRFEIEIPSPRLPLGITSYRLSDEKGAPIGAGIVFSDISDSKRLEKEQRRADKLEAVNDLMAKIAHEVRNPLTSVQTYVQLLSEKYGDDEEMNSFYKSAVTQSIQRLDSLIDRLVAFSITQDYSFYKENLGILIDEALNYIAKNSSEGGRISKGDVPGNIFIYADRKLFIKALYYLAICVIERTSRGTSITLSTKAMQGLPSVEIHLTYHGDELSREEKENLLKPMTEIQSLTSELNIPISRKIIEKHKGSIDIVSEESANTFVIRLPAIDGKTAGISINEGETDD